MARAARTVRPPAPKPDVTHNALLVMDATGRVFTADGKQIGFVKAEVVKTPDNGRHIIPKSVAPSEYKYLKAGTPVRFMTYGRLMPDGGVEVERTDYVS